MAFISIVIHVKSHASSIRFATSSAILDDAAISVTEKPGGIASDQFIASRLFKMELARIASSLCKKSTTARISFNI